MSVPDRTYNRGLSVCYPPDVKNAKFFDAGVVTMMLGPEEVLMYGRHSALRDTRLINMKVVGNFKCMNHRGGYLCAAIGLLWPIKTRKAWFKLRMLRWGVGWGAIVCIYRHLVTSADFINSLWTCHTSKLVITTQAEVWQDPCRKVPAMFEIWEMQLKRSRSNRAPRRVFRRSKCLVGHVVTAVTFEKRMDLNITKNKSSRNMWF